MPSVPTQCRGPALAKAPSEGQIKTGMKWKQVATRVCHAAVAPAHGKHSLASPWCLGDSITPATPDRHLVPAQSKPETRGALAEGQCTAAGYLHIDEILIVLVVFGEVGLNELLSACEGFMPTTTKQCYPKEAQASGNQRSKGCPDETSGTALEQT